MDKNKPILIIGAGSLGRIAYDIFEENGVVVYGFLDDKEQQGSEIDTVTVLGSTEDENLVNVIGEDCEVFIASDEFSYKQNLVEEIKEKNKAMPVNALHKNSSIAKTAHLGYGILVASGAVIAPFATVGSHSIIYANALVDAEAVLEDYVQIGAGAIVNSKVQIGEGVFIGSGAIVVSGVKIGKGAKVGAGSLVISDVPKGKTFFGNPAKEV